MRAFYAGVLRARWPLLAALVAVTAWLGSALWPPDELLVDFSFDGLLVASPEERAHLDQLRADFGEDADVVAIVVVLPEDHAASALPGPVFAPRVVRALDELAAALAARPEIDGAQVIALPHLANLRAEAITPRALGGALRALTAAAETAGLDVAAAIERAATAPGSPRDGPLAHAAERYATTAAELHAHGLYRGRFLSDDARATAVIAPFGPAHADAAARAPLLDALPALLDATRAALGPGAELHVTGVPSIQRTYSTIALRDLATFVPITTLIIVALLWLAFRNIQAVLAPMPGVAIATIAAIGLMQRAGEPINLVNNVLGVVVLVIGVADGVHIVARYQQLAPDFADKRAAIIEAMVRMTPACLVTTLTTAAGFGSLVSAANPTLRSFGAWVALAILFAFVAQLLIVPIVLSFGRRPRTTAAELARRPGVRAADALAGFALRRRVPILWATGAALAVSALGLLELDDNARALGELPEDHAASRALTAMESHLSGVMVHAVAFTGRELSPAIPCGADEDCGPTAVCRKRGELAGPPGPAGARNDDDALVIEGRDDPDDDDDTLVVEPRDDPDDDDTLVIEPRGGDETRGVGADRATRPPGVSGLCVHSAKDPAFLRALADLAAWLREHPDHRALINRVTSLADVVVEMNDALGGPRDHRGLPPDLDRATAHQLLVPLASAGDGVLSRHVTPDFTATHLTILANDTGTAAWKALRADLEPELARRFDDDPALAGRYDRAITGASTLAQRALDSIVSDMATSLAWAFAVIFALLAVLFRSLRVAAVAMLPNVWPLVVTLAAMGALGVTVRVSTVIVFSVALGIAVDDTVHYLHRFAEEIRAGRSRREAERVALVHTGRAIVVTSAILVGGFLVNALSEFVAIQQFGLLAALTLALAVIGDLVILPALVDVLRLDRALRRPRAARAERI